MLLQPEDLFHARPVDNPLQLAGYRDGALSDPPMALFECLSSGMIPRPQFEVGYTRGWLKKSCDVVPQLGKVIQGLDTNHPQCESG